MEGALLPLCFFCLVVFFFSKSLLEGLFLKKREKERKGEETSEGEFVPENNALRSSSPTKANKGAV